VKLSFLILFFLILSSASEGAEQRLKQVRPDKNKSATQNVQKTADKQPEKPSQFQAEVIETLRTIAKQNKTAYEQGRADEKSWNSPSVLVNVGLLIVGVAYTLFAWRQWLAIHRQGDIADKTLNHIDRQAAAAERTLDAIEKQVIVASDSVSVAKAAAETASRQTEILKAGQRPWIMFQVDDWGLPDRHDPSLGFGGVIKWSFRNVGHSPAFLTELVVVPDIFPYPLPNEHPDDQSPKQFAKFIIPPNGKHSSSLPTIVDAGAMQSIFDGKQCQVVYGIARYHDSMGNPHLTRFCVLRHREAEGWKFEPVGPPNWVEYT